MADDVLFGQTVQLAKVGAQFHGFLVDLVEIGLIGKPVLTDFKAAVRIVGRTACVPATVIPRKCLISRNGAISQLAVIGVDIVFQLRIVGSSGMHHDTFNLDFSFRFVAGVFRENEFVEIHLVYLLIVKLL